MTRQWDWLPDKLKTEVNNVARQYEIGTSRTIIPAEDALAEEIEKYVTDRINDAGNRLIPVRSAQLVTD